MSYLELDPGVEAPDRGTESVETSRVKDDDGKMPASTDPPGSRVIAWEGGPKEANRAALGLAWVCAVSSGTTIGSSLPESSAGEPEREVDIVMIRSFLFLFSFLKENKWGVTCD